MPTSGSRRNLRPRFRACSSGPSTTAIASAGCNHFLGHPIRFGPWRNDDCLRLFRRDVGRYVGPTDHAEVEISTGNVGWLAERMIHYTCTSYDQYLPKLQRYAAVQAGIWHEAGRRASSGTDAVSRTRCDSCRVTVWRLGFLDGLAGLQVCALIAYLSYLKHARLWELEHARPLHRLADDRQRRRRRPLGRLTRPQSLPNRGNSKRRNGFSVRDALTRFTGAASSCSNGRFDRARVAPGPRRNVILRIQGNSGRIAALPELRPRSDS